ncbi:MAG: hypothetical protein EOP61_22825 [Sphingomonadales bacterium]|nr:MAG: hypothetical protein EOP61_22825 [Sphingomonadales bacterium]
MLIATLTGAPAISASDIVVTAGDAGDAARFIDLGVIGRASDESAAGGNTFAVGHADMFPLPLAGEDGTVIVDEDMLPPALQDEHGWQ